MALLKSSFLLLTLLLLKYKLANAAVNCVDDNMENGRSIILKNDCPESFNSRFLFRQYNGTFFNPIGSNHYMTTGQLENNCGISDAIPANFGNEIVVHYYTYNNGINNPRCSLNYIGSSFGGVSIDVTNANQWRNITLRIENTGFIQIVLDCGYVNANEFIAIGNIFYVAQSANLCPLTLTTTPPTSTTTTPTSTTQETTTRTTTIDITTTEGTTTTCSCVC